MISKLNNIRGEFHFSWLLFCEVECMVLGTIPIVSDGVSMDYNNYLVGGIHYIREK
jgi:hypothetical protein